MAETEGRKDKSRRKHRSRHSDETVDDYVDREVSRAMKQMEKAMKQAKLAEKASEKAFKASQGVPEGVSFTTDQEGKGIKIIHKKYNHPGNLIFMENVDTVQVGCHNNVVINKSRKTSSRQRRGSDSDDDTTDRRTHRETQRDDTDIPETPERLQAVLRSERQVTADDISVVCQFVGMNWRRVLRQLKLDDTLIEQIQHDYQPEGLRQIIYEGVLVWTQREGYRATVGVLAGVLQKTEHYDALKYLQP